MARKSSGDGWWLILLLIIGALASIPKEVWIGIAVLGGLGFVAYYFLNKESAPQPQAPEQASDTREERPNVFVSARLGSDFGLKPDPKITSAQCWVPPGQAVGVGGLNIVGGMLYVGSRLPSVSGYEVEPALIDPKLPVHRVGEASRMPYWPNYSGITPEARGEYLDWLASGQRNPNVQMGCVFLFFYGLERRVLYDVNSIRETVSAEVSAITAELERLLSIYGGNGSFQSYASNFLDLVKGGAQVTGKLYERPAPEPSGWRGLRLAHKLALGQAARDGVPLPADWAYSWLMYDAATFLRKPAERCLEKFRRLFTALYNQRYARGMILPANRTRLKLTYRPASASFGGQLEFNVGELPDVTVLERPISELRSLASEAIDALDPYSRFIGRNPDKRETMDAIALLPPLLWPRDSLLSLGAWVKQLGVDHEMQATSLAELMRHFPDWGTMNKDRARAFASALEQFGVSMEPDVRWGGPLPAESAPVVLFSIPHEERGKKPSALYSAAALTMHLAATVSGADGVSVEEEKYLQERVERMLDLQGHERLRLRAHLKWLLLSKPNLTAIKKRVAGLDASQRTTIGAFVVNVAHVEGGLAAAEMKALAKIYRLLDLPEDSLYRHAHAAAIEPVSLKSGEKPGKRLAVPAEPTQPPAPTEGVLDAERIARLKEESARVSAILGAILGVEDQAKATEQPEEVAPAPEPTLAGLDIEHSHFASVLVSRDKWARAELEDLASDRGIMLDGALERVNEAFADVYGEPLLDGNDPVEINKNVLRELQPA